MITFIEYYEEYFLVNGKKPPPLRDHEKRFLDDLEKIKNDENLGQIIIYSARRYRNRILASLIKETIEINQMDIPCGK